MSKNRERRALLTEHEVAAVLGVNFLSLRTARCIGRGDLSMPYYKLGDARLEWGKRHWNKSDSPHLRACHVVFPSSRCHPDRRGITGCRPSMCRT